MKECDKRNSHISSKLHVIYISYNNDRHPVTKTFIPLHYTCRHFTSTLLNEGKEAEYFLIRRTSDIIHKLQSARSKGFILSL
jgi:hypothetical protein